jgi:hypothetical protein
LERFLINLQKKEKMDNWRKNWRRATIGLLTAGIMASLVQDCHRDFPCTPEVFRKASGRSICVDDLKHYHSPLSFTVNREDYFIDGKEQDIIFFLHKEYNIGGGLIGIECGVSISYQFTDAPSCEDFYNIK